MENRLISFERITRSSYNKDDRYRLEVAMIVPSCRDEGGKWEGILEKHFDRYENVKGMSNINWLYNLQNYNDEEYEWVMDKLRTAMELNPTWSAYIARRDKYEVVSMRRIRHDTALMLPNADIFVYLDDDVYFNEGAGEHYDRIIRYMTHFKNCGAIMSAGFLGSYSAKNEIRISPTKVYFTNLGLFVRNIKDEIGSLLIPSEYLDDRGPYEELQTCLELMKRGYYLGTAFRNRSFHRHGKVTKDDPISTKPNGQVPKVRRPKEPRFSGDNSVHGYEDYINVVTKFFKNDYGLELDPECMTENRYLMNAMKHVYKKFYIPAAKERWGHDAFHSKNKAQYQIDIDELEKIGQTSDH